MLYISVTIQKTMIDGFISVVNAYCEVLHLKLAPKSDLLTGCGVSSSL